MNPTPKPHCQPQIRPHSSTGMCMGSSIWPTAGSARRRRAAQSRSPKTRRKEQDSSGTVLYGLFSLLLLLVSLLPTGQLLSVRRPQNTNHKFEKLKRYRECDVLFYPVFFVFLFV